MGQGNYDKKVHQGSQPIAESKSHGVGLCQTADALRGCIVSHGSCGNTAAKKQICFGEVIQTTFFININQMVLHQALCLYQ